MTQRHLGSTTLLTCTDGAGIAYSGDSLATDFKGLPLAEATGEQTVTVTLDLTRLAAFRQHWPFYLDFDPSSLT